MDYAANHWQLIAVVLGAFILLVCYRWVLAVCGVIIVPDDSVGVMTKKFVLVGKNRRLPAGRIIALNGEAGYQADTLPPGLQGCRSKFCSPADVSSIRASRQLSWSI
jgi:hypothetical protein